MGPISSMTNITLDYLSAWAGFKGPHFHPGAPVLLSPGPTMVDQNATIPTRAAAGGSLSGNFDFDEGDHVDDIVEAELVTGARPVMCEELLDDEPTGVRDRGRSMGNGGERVDQERGQIEVYSHFAAQLALMTSRGSIEEVPAVDIMRAEAEEFRGLVQLAESNRRTAVIALLSARRGCSPLEIPPLRYEESAPTYSLLDVSHLPEGSPAEQVSLCQSGLLAALQGMELFANIRHSLALLAFATGLAEVYFDSVIRERLTFWAKVEPNLGGCDIKFPSREVTLRIELPLREI